jgi:hypothetical protein
MLNRLFCGAIALSTLLALSSIAFAQGRTDPDAPEVDPGSMASALVLLAAGGALIADQVRRKIRAKT